MCSLAGIGNVLARTRNQVVALGCLGGSHRWIEEATEVRRETASAYLKAAGIPRAAGVDGRESGLHNRPPGLVSKEISRPCKKLAICNCD